MLICWFIKELDPPTRQSCEGNLFAWEENPFFSLVIITTLWYFDGIEAGLISAVRPKEQ